MWITLALLLAPSVFAEGVPAVLLTEDVSIEKTVSDAASHAHADVSGAGKTLQLNYSTKKPLNMYIVPKGASVFQTLSLVLPAGTHTDATINLSRSSAWHPGLLQYRLYFFSNADAGAEFHDIEFTDASLIDDMTAGASQLAQRTPYSPASYHRILPYAVFGMSMSVICGIALLLVFSWVSVRRKSAVIAAVICVVLLTDLRFSLDATTYAIEHTSAWITDNYYASAGSLPAIAADLQSENAREAYLCHTGTTYASKLLQYHAYPVVIGSTEPSHIVVHKSVDWSLSGDTLHCGTSTWAVEKIKEYSDGSILFRVTS